MTLDLAIDASDLHARLNQTVAQALVVPFRMIVLKELDYGPSRGFLSEDDQAIQTLTLQASHESFHVRIQVWRSCGQLHGVYVSLLENGTERLAELRIAVHDQIPAAKKESVD